MKLNLYNTEIVVFLNKQVGIAEASLSKGLFWAVYLVTSYDVLLWNYFGVR